MRKDINTAGEEIRKTAEMLADNMQIVLAYALELQENNESYDWGKELAKSVEKFQSYAEQIETFFSEPIE